MTKHTHRVLEAEAASTELFSTKLICEGKKNQQTKNTQKNRE